MGRQLIAVLIAVVMATAIASQVSIPERGVQDRAVCTYFPTIDSLKCETYNPMDGV